jgi:hypothetical protein
LGLQNKEQHFLRRTAAFRRTLAHRTSSLAAEHRSELHLWNTSGLDTVCLHEAKTVTQVTARVSVRWNTLLRAYPIAKDIYNLSVALHERPTRSRILRPQPQIAFANIVWKQSHPGCIHFYCCASLSKRGSCQVHLVYLLLITSMYYLICRITATTPPILCGMGKGLETSEMTVRARVAHCTAAVMVLYVRLRSTSSSLKYTCITYLVLC